MRSPQIAASPSSCGPPTRLFAAGLQSPAAANKSLLSDFASSPSAMVASSASSAAPASILARRLVMWPSKSPVSTPAKPSPTAESSSNVASAMSTDRKCSGIPGTAAVPAPPAMSRPRPHLITYGVPWKGTVPQRVRIPPGKLSLQPVAIGADDGGNDIVRSTSVERVALGDPATMRAATRVNAEQASKPGMREPTRRYVGEGWHWPGSERQAHRLVPPGYWRRHAWKRGMGATREALSVVWHAPTGTP